ncbi:MAG: hypothetical protein P4L10_06115 [Acidobacteriaceae bacterium]|jgi:hypothetical protein|nr:hypothetical protein [Acidobacteriaceae bacterium]
MSDWSGSPFVVPIGAFIAWFGVVAVKTISRYQVRKLQSQERLAAIEKGLPVAPEDPSIIEKTFGERESSRPSNPLRRIGYLRTSGIVCISVGVGLVLFFMALAHIIQEHMVLCGAATGIIPLAIGAGLLLDARMQANALKADQAAAAPTPVEPPVYPPDYPQQ